MIDDPRMQSWRATLGTRVQEIRFRRLHSVSSFVWQGDGVLQVDQLRQILGAQYGISEHHG